MSADKTDKTELAENRTDWAEDRTLLANERTFAGWMRTGMAAIAVALGLKAVFGAFEPTWVPKAIATLFVAMGIFTFLAARRQARATLKRLHGNDTDAQPSSYISWLAIGLSVASAGVGAVLWLL
jgi:putative membrane protein